MNAFQAALMAGAAAGLAACSDAPEPVGAVVEAVVAEQVAAPAAEPDPVIWTARGNEPGWMLTVEGDALTLVHSYGEGTYESGDVAVETTDNGRVYRTGDGALVATVTDAPCADDMSGMPYPSGVVLQYTDMTLRGCGGEPEELLAGKDWQVETIQGERLAEGSSVTMVFDTAERRVSGTGGCNSYGASYKLSGEGLTFSPPVSTEMACAEPLMTQESAFLQALAGIAMFEVDETGALHLDGHGGERITARR
jgi:heat shock protein HslJ